MALTSTLAASLLKRHYKGDVRQWLNENAILYQICSKSPHKTGGSLMEWPIHVARASNAVGVMNETDNLVSPDYQRHETIQVRTKILDASVLLYESILQKAAAKGKFAFARAMQTEMKGNKNDIRQFMDRLFLFGGQTVGIIGGSSTTGTGASALTTAAAEADGTAGSGLGGTGAGADWWDYDGDYDVFDGSNGETAVTTATVATWVRVKLMQIDRTSWGDTVEEVGSPTNLGIFVADYNKATQQIRLAVVADAADDGYTLANQDAGMKHCAVLLHETQYVDTVNSDDLGTVRVTYKKEPQGILDWLFNPNYGNDEGNSYTGIDRSVASGNDYGRTFALTATRTASTYARAAQDLQRIDELDDKIWDEFNVDNDCIVMNAMQRSKHKALLRAFDGYGGQHPTTRTSKAQMAITSLAYANPNGDARVFKISKRMPKGMLLFLQQDVWFMGQLKRGDWLARDGNILKLYSTGGANKAAWISWWYHEYNHYTDDPRPNGVITMQTFA